MASDNAPESKRAGARPSAGRFSRGRPPAGVKRPASELTTLANVLPAVGRALGLERKAAELAAMALWGELVPKPYDAHSRALKILRRGDVCALQVGVSDGAVASDLSFQLEAIRERLNVFAAQTGIVIDRIELMTR